ncbi:hypothetical protein DERP_015082 [Dermatophagoides pteronyssinus]|uniref:Transmembrane protein n=1 Tax=Dermatophagoides pteronyssinus TaxID=6956 RepID=A0ABQ8JSA5_DERPT|nr:hypothetical protein DERP_015082 [Dermatophagoides pteronyssinus]
MQKQTVGGIIIINIIYIGQAAFSLYILNFKFSILLLLQITDYNGDGGVTTISTKVMNDC